MGGQDAAPSPVQSCPPLAQISHGKYYAVSSSPSASPCPKQYQHAISSQHTHAVHPAQKTWRRPLMVRQPYSVAVRAPRRSGYIPLLLRRRGLGGRGGAFLNGKEGRVGFRKNEVELPLERETEGFEKNPLERVSVPYKGNRRGRKDYCQGGIRKNGTSRLALGRGVASCPPMIF